MEKGYYEVINAVWNNGGKALSNEIVKVIDFNEQTKEAKVLVSGTSDVLFVKESNLRVIETSGIAAKIGKKHHSRRQNKMHEVGDSVIILEVNEDETKVLIKNKRNHFLGWVNEEIIAGA